MSEQVSKTYKYRKNFDGVDCVAPFFGSYNVWDIPLPLWKEPVRKAIEHAFELGYRQAREDMSNSLSNTPSMQYTDWDKVT